MKLTNLKIGTQLKIAFGAILLLILIMGTIAWQMNNRLSDQITTLAEHPLKVTNAVRKLSFDIMAMRLEFRNYLLAATEKEKQQSVISSDVYEADGLDQINILFDRYLGPREDVEAVHTAFVSWVSIRKSNRNMTNVAEAFSRVESTGDIGIERDKLLQCVSKVERFAFKKAEELTANANFIKQSQNLSFIILVLLILGAVGIILVLLDRTLRQPIVDLAEINTLFREGNRKARSNYVSNSEIGHLAESFNLLAEAVEDEIALSKKSASLAETMLSKNEAHSFCSSLLKNLLELVDAQIAAIYFLNDKISDYECFESIGLSKDACKTFSSTTFEGEFGLALSTKEIQYIKQIPDDTRFLFHTAEGKFVPREIITIPVVSGNVSIAVISLVTVKYFDKSTFRLLSSIYSMLCARIEGVMTFIKLEEFTRQLEQQKITLESQKEELHILNNELARKSDTLIQANSELSEQRRELAEQANELMEQNIELEIQKKHLDESNKLKTTFLSNMSHELRTPLNSVIALSGVLNRRLTGIIPEEEHSYINVIERNGRQLLSLINEILDLSRIESGREEIALNQFNLKDLVEEVVELIRPLADTKNIRLTYLISESLPGIESDYVKCRHILQNLVSNAVKFTEKGSVKIGAETRDAEVKVTVTDTGIGIPRSYLPFIFDEFRQGDGSSSRKFGGTGLGLAIARKYAEMLGGKIEVKSQPGEGSVFTVTLPLEISSNANNAEPYLSQSGSKNQVEKNDVWLKNILIVEDSEAAVVQIRDILEQEGYNTRIAHNGAEALKEIETNVPDGMILDLMMPEIDGFEVLKRIRERDETAQLPVIILTAKYITKSELAFLKHNNVYQLIQKGDIGKEQLLATVARMIFKNGDEKKEVNEKITTRAVSGKPKILVVEDNADNMITIKALLNDKFILIEADNGNSAVEKAIAHVPDLILMDIALPGINGIEAMNKIRENDHLNSIPIIAVSASAMKGDREDFIALGFDSYISKPIDHHFFEKTIAEFLN
jgi:Signal transduction histidine kinase